MNTPLARKPKGYVGKGHETVGADILAILKILKLPEQVLGQQEARKLATVEARGHYPIAWLLELMERVDAQVGTYGLIRMGRTVFRDSVPPGARERLRSAKDLVSALDGLYKHTNRGTEIGGWRVLAFEPGLARLEKTTPHHCMMEQGILVEAFSFVGCPVTIEQSQCFRKGSDACVYEVTSYVTDERWTGAPAP